MQSLEFNGLRVEIFALHAPSFGSATRVQPLRSTPDTLPDTSTSAQFVSSELLPSPSSARDDPPAVPFGLSAQATSSEPPVSAAPNTPLVTSIAPAFPSSLAAPKEQAIQPTASFVLDTRPEFMTVTDSISPASSILNTALTASAQTALPRLDAVPIIYLHALEFEVTGTGEIYELVSRQSGADFVLAAIYLNEA